MYCSDIFGEYICPPFSVFVIGIRFLLVGFNTLIAGGNMNERAQLRVSEKIR
jgi:hypothetical protein